MSTYHVSFSVRLADLAAVSAIPLDDRAQISFAVPVKDLPAVMRAMAIIPHEDFSMDGHRSGATAAPRRRSYQIHNRRGRDSGPGHYPGRYKTIVQELYTKLGRDFTVREATDAFLAEGYSYGSVRPLLNSLCEAGALQKVSEERGNRTFRVINP